jgi:hypothetical protein
VDTRLEKSMVNHTLVEVVPCFKTPKSCDRIGYKRILEHLNIKTLRQIIKSHVPYPDWKVEETEDYLTYQFEDKEKIYISKENGRVFSEVNNEHSQYQAFWLIRLLAKYGYVEDFKRIQRHNAVQFLENP